MYMQKVILFDFFGVVCPDIGKALLVSQARKRAQQRTMLYKMRHAYKYVYDSVRQNKIIHDEKKPDIQEVDCLDPEMITLIRELKAAGHRIGIASNANQTWIHSILSKGGITDVFENILISSSVGFIKPDERFFVKICDAFQCGTQDCVLIDDNAYNIEAAQRFGMSGIRYTNIANLRTELMHMHVL